MSASDDQIEKECPLCMEQLDLDELNFFPCKCGYQICQFCWNRIKQEENGLCPACRQPYPEQPADFKPLSAEELKKIQQERRKREQQRKQKMSENRKHLANMRVVQRNLVLVHGLSPRLGDAELLKRNEYFGQFGKIYKIVIGTNSSAPSGGGGNSTATSNNAQGPSTSVYVTYFKEEDAVKAIIALNQKTIEGRILRASLGTTKYCSCFLQNKPCQKTDCMYLHEVGDTEASFTKEDMATKKHEDYERKVCEEIVAKINLNSGSTTLPQQQLRGADVFPSTLANSDVSSSKSRDSSVTPLSHSAGVADYSDASPPGVGGATVISSTNNNSNVTTVRGGSGGACRTNQAPRHRNRPHSQIQLHSEMKCISSSPPEPSAPVEGLQRCSTLDNSSIVMQNLAAGAGGGGATNVAASVGFAPLAGPGSMTSLEQTNSVVGIGGVGGATSSSSSLPSSVASFLKQKPPATGGGVQPPVATHQPTSTMDWPSSRILAAIQQPSSNNQSLFSHDDDAFYRQKLRQLHTHHHQQQQLQQQSQQQQQLQQNQQQHIQQSQQQQRNAMVIPDQSSTGGGARGGATILGGGDASSIDNNPLNKLLMNNVPIMNGMTNGIVLDHLNSRCPGGASLTGFKFDSNLDKNTSQDDFLLLSGDNLKVRSQTDWQAAFGFGKSDDDLGFDPFSESSKALEDLVREEREKEIIEKQQRRDNMLMTENVLLQQQQLLKQKVQQQQQQQVPQGGLWPLGAHAQQQPHHGTAGFFGASSSTTSLVGGAAALPSFFNDGTATAGSGGSGLQQQHQQHHPGGFISPNIFRYNNSAVTNDFNPNKLMNGGIGGYNGLNAQAAPFVPRQIGPNQQQQQHHQHREQQQQQPLSVKDMQEQFKAFFPDASVKFTSHLNAASPLSCANMVPPPPTVPRSTAGWPPHRLPDPRQSMFSRPPPPLATNPGGPGPLCFPRPPVKLSPNGSDMPPPFHQPHPQQQHHPQRISAPLGVPQFGTTNTSSSVFSDYSGWPVSGLAPTPPPGFAPPHQNSS